MLKISRATLCLCLLTVLLGTCSPANYPSLDTDAFTIQHSSTGMCLGTTTLAGLGLTSCDPNNVAQLWKWGSGHRLFQVATSLCLALDVHSKTLFLDDCGSDLLVWRCLDGVVYTFYHMGLFVGDGKVYAKVETNDTWQRGASQDDICQSPYRIVHTTGDNSNGKPCVFPFKYNGSWHHGCLPYENISGLSWCATSLDYDQDRERGYCLLPEEGCKTLFTGPEGESCYQLCLVQL